MIASICSDPKVLGVMRIVNIIIDIIRIVVPILLIFVLIFKLVSAITNNDKDALAKVKKSAIPNIVATVIIFLIPSLISLIVKITFPNNDYINCIKIKSIAQINEVYENKMEELVSKAEETLNINDYNNAMLYLKNIKDEEKKKEYEEKLKIVKDKIDEASKPNSKTNEYVKVIYDNFRWFTYKAKSGPVNTYYSNMTPYAIWAPEDINDLNGVSLPLIVWLHGAGELTYQPNMTIEYFAKTALPEVISKWNKYNLEPIPAIIVAPQSGGDWVSHDKNLESIKALIEYSKDTYNIDEENIVLMGHSLGGVGVVKVSYEMQKKYNIDYFNKLVIMSGFTDLRYPKNDLNSGYNYFSSKPIRDYDEKDEDNASIDFFNWLGKSTDDLLIYKGVSHSKMPEVAIIEDKDNNGISDLIEWLFYKE